MSPRSVPSRPIRRWALVLYWLAMYMATHWPDVDQIIPVAGWPFPHFSEIIHFAIYAGWAAMWWWVLSGHDRRVSGSTIAWLMAGGAAYAAFDELTQRFASGRHPDPVDFLIDLSGLLLANAILFAWQQYRSSPRAKATTPPPP